MVDHQTIKYEKTAIHKMLPIKVMGKNFRLVSLRVSGRVIHMGKIKGNTKMYDIRLLHVSGQDMSKGADSSSSSPGGATFNPCK